MLLTEAEATKDLPRDARLGETAGKMKQFATWFTHGVPGGAKLRAAIYQARTGAAVLSEVERFFAAPFDSQDAIAAGLVSEMEQVYPDGELICD
jgi:hypothetical protein